MLKCVAIAVLSIMVTAALAAWLLAGNGPKPLRSGMDDVVSLVTGTDPYSRCWDKVPSATGGVEYRFALPRDCYRFAPSRVYAGVYIDEFEGQQFIEGVKGRPPYHQKFDVWLELDEVTRQQLFRSLPPVQQGKTRIWQVVFTGRQAIGSGGFGHFGGFDGLVVVDTVKSARFVASYDGYLPDNMRH